MTDFSEILAYSKNKTRVLIYSSQPLIATIILEILQFHHKEFDYFLDNGISQQSKQDFVIFETSDPKKAADFQPNIVFISNEISSENTRLILDKITGGGVVIFPEIMEKTIDSAENYFRKLSFPDAKFKINNSNYFLESEFGEIPLQVKDESVIKNILGLKLLAQQFAILEEEFYEPVMNFQEL